MARLPQLIDDGLYTEPIGAWGEEKYRLVATYARMFATSMKGKWECRVYIDLFAGAGHAHIKNTKRIVPASPMVALDIKDKFDKYIFCDADPLKIKALQERVSKAYPSVNSQFILGDTNKSVDSILQEIPQHRKGFKVLSFCFADPYKLANLKFETIRQMSSRFIDFLILIPSGMDANRNISRYINPTNRTVDLFLGTSEWRDEWKQAKSQGESFGHYITRRFSQEMEVIGYPYSRIEETKHIRSTDKNLPLYHLAFFSRNELGQKFWEQARKYSQEQGSFKFEQ
ncbi:MAG TPA: three-Cys-motif partner protein TcmP [Nitrososphaera sp.]|nr:three-Cys-motif partner protein TcmP [Nitrososphaera sp.]